MVTRIHRQRMRRASRKTGAAMAWFFLLLLSLVLLGTSSALSDDNIRDDRQFCPTGESRLVLQDLTTGDFILVEETDTTNIHSNQGNPIFGDRRNLLRARSSIPNGITALEAASASEPIYVTSSSGRFLSIDGSNSVSTATSNTGNTHDNENNSGVESYSTSALFTLRPCTCLEDVTEHPFCSASSDFCGLASFLDENGQRKPKVECYSMSHNETVAINVWPLLWLMYLGIFSSICCTFQGRILLDFVKGTILYYICGFGDRLGNRQLRSIDRYNHSIVQEILEEERIDREDVRRRRSGRLGRQMNAIAQTTTTTNPQIPPTIETSPTEEDGGAGAAANPNEAAARGWFQTIMWPWQTSWDRYIKYNLLLRVEWIAMRDEVAFIESRQQRGLPHARYEMKTRVWTSEESCQEASSASSLNSLDAPHCTICFMELENGDKVGDLGCVHVFHADCLKAWVQKRNSCPLCNIPVARRRRIHSEEFVKEQEQQQQQQQQQQPEPQFDQQQQHREDDVGGSIRLTHIPMTPSTIAADTYSNYSEEMASDRSASSSPYSHDEEALSNATPNELPLGESNHSSPPTPQDIGGHASILHSPPRQLHRRSFSDEPGQVFAPAIIEAASPGTDIGEDGNDVMHPQTEQQQHRRESEDAASPMGDNTEGIQEESDALDP